MPSKRSAPSDASQSGVRKKIRPSGSALLETTSIEERAEPFRLMTVKFPIDSVTPEWSTGWNRKVNEKHVKQLCQLFGEYGVDRLDRAHRVRLLCSAQDVRLMCEHIGIECTPNDPSTPLPSFQGWGNAIADAAEVLAGNHRIQALKAYLKRQKLGDSDDERWWVCDIFDRDTLPVELQIELRANRSGTVLPDTHGQIWTELRTCAEQDKSGTMFSGARGEVEAQMSRALRLNTREQFPVRRLAILWKNDRWRAFINRLCSRRAGKDLFNISVFQKLSSYRIDDYLFERIESMMRPVDVVWEKFGIELELDRDYARLAGLQGRWQPQELFYPKEHDGLSIDEDSPRHSRFLSHVDSPQYHALYRYLVEPRRELSFPNAHELLRTLNSSGKTMQAVMTHVVMWLNDDLASVKDREGNKPPLVEELLSVASSVLKTAVGRGPCPAAEAKVLELQRRVLACVEENAAAFTKDDLSSLPEADAEPKAYQERFRLEVWRDVLARVQEVIGARLRNPCVSNFNVEAVEQPVQRTRLGLVDTLREVIVQHPGVVGNPTLESSEAIEALRVRMQEVVAQWKREYGQGGLEPQGKHYRPAAVIPELARFRDASFGTSSVDDENNRNCDTETTRDSVATHNQAAQQKRTKRSLFVGSSESEDDFDPPRAPVARMVPLSPRMKGHEVREPVPLSSDGQPRTMAHAFSDDDRHAEREPSSRNRSAAKAPTAQKPHRLLREEATSTRESSETGPRARTLGSAFTASHAPRPHAKGQRRGWRAQPFAGA